MNAIEVQRAALSLSPQEKASLADVLIDSITKTISEQNQNKWLDVANKRVGDFKQNQSLGRPLSEFMAELQSRLS